jgi:tetratricopeptide (TPR) repeat protein
VSGGGAMVAHGNVNAEDHMWCSLRTIGRPRVAGVLLLLAAGASPRGAGAQDAVRARPRLAGDADTNSAAAYYYHGLDRLNADDPHQAVDAFYWASRLAPDWADPLYALRVALLLSQPERLVGLMEEERWAVESPAGRRVDSLRLRALLLDPFVYEDLERRVILGYVTERVMVALRREYRTGDVEFVRREVENEARLYLRTPQAAAWRAWIAYSERRLDEAARLYGEALKRTREPDVLSRLRVQRARAFYLGGHTDSALAELRQALQDLRRRDEDVVIRVYESKALLEHSLGVALERAGDRAAARDAYERALVEDLAFYPAHVRLSGLLAAAGDTARARAELETALDVAPDAAVVRMLLANHYHGGGDHRAALATLEPLLEREPYWAEAHLLRALAHDELGQRVEAAAQYGMFLALSEARDDRRAAVERRAAALRDP